jgi:hypothetical protein
MSLIGFLFTLVIGGVVLWLINNCVPMDPKIKTTVILGSVQGRRIR